MQLLGIAGMLEVDFLQAKRIPFLSPNPTNEKQWS